MKRIKNLEQELRSLGIPFWRTENPNEYMLWSKEPGIVYDLRACWKLINWYKNNNRARKRRQFAKRLQNKKIRKYNQEEKPVYKPDRCMWD